MTKRRVLLAAALMGMLLALTVPGTAWAQKVCFSVGSSQVILEIGAIGGTTFLLGGDWLFTPSVSNRLVGSARLRSDQSAEFGATVTAGGASLIVDGILNPPLYNQGSGTLINLTAPVAQPVTFSPLPACPPVPD